MARTLACLAVLLLPLAGLAQGKLDQVREAVDRPPDPPRPADSKPGSSDDSDDFLADLFGPVFVYAFAAPWLGPHAALDPGLDVPGRFTRYPYAAPDTGHIALDRRDRPWDERVQFLDRPDTQWYSVRATAEVGGDFDGLTRTGVRLFLDTDTRFGLKSDWDYYVERLPCGCRDDLGIGDVTATYRFVQHEQIQMHTGLGARFLIDHGRDRAGANFLYGFDAFPVQPAHLFGSFEAGTLGTAGVLRFHGGAGATWRSGELFAGYDYLWISGATLQGPFVGLRLWY